VSKAYKTDQVCDSCGASRGKAYYPDNSSHCFACRTTKHNDVYDEGTPVIKVPKQKPEGHHDKPTMAKIQAILGTGEYNYHPERKLSIHTCKKFSCLYTHDRTYFGYFNEDDHRIPVAAKIRYPGKKFNIVGKWEDTTLFGQNAFTTQTGKYVTITEGEYDAMSAFQMTGSQYATVSLRNGAQSAKKDCQKQKRWLDKFERIYICFDDDEHGRRAAKEVSTLFKDKAYIFKHEPGFKDASEYLVAGEEKLFIKRFWDSEKYIPEEILNGADLWQKVMEPPCHSDLGYPFPSINKLTYGIRDKELITICAGSGLGKSQFMREIIYEVFTKTQDNIGMLFLEESAAKTVESIMSLYLNKPLHLPIVDVDVDERRRAFDSTVASKRFFLYEHFGSTEIDTIVSTIEYLAAGSPECKYIFLDHLTMVVSAQNNADERLALDELMTKLRTAVQELGICLFCVSHLKRPDGKGHEDGGLVSLSQLRGSGAIAHLSDICIGLERNGQADDPIERNTTHIRVLKNRFSGLTGKCGSVYYDEITGRLSELEGIDAV